MTKLELMEMYIEAKQVYRNRIKELEGRLADGIREMSELENTCEMYDRIINDLMKVKD